MHGAFKSLRLPLMNAYMIQAKVLVARSFTPGPDKQDAVGVGCRLLSPTDLDSHFDFINYTLNAFEKMN